MYNHYALYFILERIVYMKNIRKITALICAVSIMAIVSGCGSKDEKATSESAAETVTAEVTTQASEEETTEESSEKETEEATEEATEESAEEKTTEENKEAENDADTDEDNSTADTQLDMDGTLGTLNYKYSSEWKEAVSGDQKTYTFSDLSGAIVIQKHSADGLGSLSEETTIQVLAEQCESAWESLDNMELVSSDWVEGVVDGKKCYAVTYTYNISSIETTNTTFFFANYTDDSKDLFAVTASALTEESNAVDIAKEILSNVSFS